MKVESICIVGGGSSGWMTAASICKGLPDVKLTLVESKRIGNIGVGESTLGHINTFMHSLGLKDEDWMKACNATYKASIKFVDFSKVGDTFHYPFGKFNVSDCPEGLMTWFNWKAKDPTVKSQNFAEFFNHQVKMIDANKMSNNSDGAISGFDFNDDTAYHMDASLFGEYLRDNICIPSGMTHVYDDVLDANVGEDGNLKSITTKEAGEITADLYIDCTGFQSILLDKALKEPFINFGDTLLNDRACAAQVPYIDKDKEMESVTSCTGIEAGWVWNIPLYNRIGTGYVYSSKYATQNEAEQQFRTHLAKTDPKRAEEAKVIHLKIRHGIHKRLWVKNVVGVGLSAGFIEPLESTGLMLTHESVKMLVSTLSGRDGRVNRLDRDSYNFAVRETMESFRSFISQHYAMSTRDDTPYWKHVTEDIEYDKVLGNYCGAENPRPNAYVDHAFRLHFSRTFDTEMGGYPYIVAGSGLNPITDPIVQTRENKVGVEDDTWKLTKELWEKRSKDLDILVDKMPTHYQYLKEMYGD